MARYVDADEILKKLPDNLKYKSSVKRVLMSAPEISVVPMRVAEKWYHESRAAERAWVRECMCHSSTQKLVDKYCAQLQTVRVELVKEIFEKINLIITKHYNRHIFGIMELSDTEKEAVMDFSDDITLDLDKLEKEYTEGNSDAENS